MNGSRDGITNELTGLSLAAFLAALAAKTPVPGGGSASAAGVAMAAALVEMVAGLSGADERWAPLRAQAARLRGEALRLAEEDSRAFAGVMQALRLPKTTVEEQQQRKEILARANSEAATVPLRTVGTALAVLRLAVGVAEEGNPRAVSDAGVAGALALAGARGAALNVRINLPSLAELERREILVRLEPMEQEAEETASRVGTAVARRM